MAPRAMRPIKPAAAVARGAPPVAAALDVLWNPAELTVEVAEEEPDEEEALVVVLEPEAEAEEVPLDLLEADEAVDEAEAEPEVLEPEAEAEAVEEETGFVTLATVFVL